MTHESTAPLGGRQTGIVLGTHLARITSRGLGWPRAAGARRKSPLRPNRRGAAVTEFAIVAPIFLLLVIGIIELGRALMVQQVLVNASRVGARQAITLGATTTDVQTAVQDYAATVAVPNVSVSVTPNPGTASAGDMISVTTSVDFENVSWLAAPWFLDGRTLSSSSQMRKEGFE